MKFSWIKTIIIASLIVTGSQTLANDALTNEEQVKFSEMKHALSEDLNQLLQRKLDSDAIQVLRFTSKHKLDCGKDGLDIYNQCEIYFDESYPYLWLYLNEKAQTIAYMGDVLDTLDQGNKSDCRPIINQTFVCFTPLMAESDRQLFIERYKPYLKAAN